MSLLLLVSHSPLSYKIRSKKGNSIFSLGCYYTHGSEIGTNRTYTHALMYGGMSERGGCLLGWRPGQLGVRCLAHGHLGSAHEVNWHLSSYQSTLYIFIISLSFLSRALRFKSTVPSLEKPPRTWTLLLLETLNLEVAQHRTLTTVITVCLPKAFISKTPEGKLLLRLNLLKPRAEPESLSRFPYECNAHFKQISGKTAEGKENFLPYIKSWFIEINSRWC